MPEYLAPGVYVEEINTGPRPIEGVSTSTAGFVGETERGSRRPTLVTSWSDFVRAFGTYVDAPQTTTDERQSAVRGPRVLRQRRPAALRRARHGPQCRGRRNGTLPGAAGATTTRGDRPRRVGQPHPRRVRPASAAASLHAGLDEPAAKWFRIQVLYYREAFPNPFVDPTDPTKLADPNRKDPDAFEDFDNLTHDSTRPNFAQTVINGASNLIRVDDCPGSTNRGRIPNAGTLPDTAGTDVRGRPARVHRRPRRSRAADGPGGPARRSVTSRSWRFPTTSSTQAYARRVAGPLRERRRTASRSSTRRPTGVDFQSICRSTATAATARCTTRASAWPRPTRRRATSWCRRRATSPASTRAPTSSAACTRRRPTKSCAASSPATSTAAASRSSTRSPSASTTSSTRAASTSSATSAPTTAASASGARGRCRPTRSGSTSTSAGCSSSSRSRSTTARSGWSSSRTRADVDRDPHVDHQLPARPSGATAP